MLFCPLGGGSALVLLMEIFKWIVKRLVGVLFLGGVTCGGDFGQLGYNLSDTTLSHIARLPQIWRDKVRPS